MWPQRISLVKRRDQVKCILCKESESKLFLEYKGYPLYECHNCGLVFPNISIENDQNIAMYDNALYEETLKREILETYAYRKEKFGSERLKYVQKMAPIDWTKATLLDIGCGPGYFIQCAKDSGVNALGIELTDFLVKLCQNNGLNVEKKRLEELTFHSDVMTMFDVLEHLADPIAFFQEAYQKLNSKGYIVAYTPHVHSLAFLLQEGLQNTLLPFEHLGFFDAKSAEFLAKKSGFEVVNIDYYGWDVMDYLSMKSYEDKIDYNENLKEMIPYLQASLDKNHLSNHIRITFRKLT